MDITLPSPSLPASEHHWQRCYARYGDLLLKLVEWHDNSSISERCEDTAASIDALTPTPTEPISIEHNGQIDERNNPERHLRQLWYYLDAQVKKLPPKSPGHNRLIAMLAELIKLGGDATFEAEVNFASDGAESFGHSLICFSLRVTSKSCGEIYRCSRAQSSRTGKVSCSTATRHARMSLNSDACP
jgi:hypothetical protein